MSRRARLAALFGTVLLTALPLTAQPNLGTEAERAKGQEVYAKWCAQCHGDAGDGAGYAAPHLRPAPRDFTSAKYRLRSTPTGTMPTDDDLRRVIREGIPYTGMPAFPDLSAAEVTGLVHYLKTFADDFQDEAAYAPPVDLPPAPPFSPEGIEAARQVYQEIGCARCHGDEGRGDGTSAPTLVDDWGVHIRAADLTRPWTFRGGASREAVFRAMTTGLFGTPMAGFEDGLTVEQRWQIVDFITAISDGATEPDFANLVIASPATGELSLERGRELFDSAEGALLPVLGQVIQPGRAFFPGVIAVEVKAVFDADEIAFLVTWHDFQANRAGSNGPDLPAEEGSAADADGAGDDGGGFWGDEVADEEDDGGGFWGDEAVEEEGDGGDFWGEDAAGEGGDDFWGQDEPAAAPSADTSEYSDAIALQFPRTQPTGIRKPYFLFGDGQNPVELWYLDLGADDGEGVVWEGRGAAALIATDELPPETRAEYADGEWAVMFKRSRRSGAGIEFAESTFVPLALSVWDGFYEERGSKRGVTSWYHVFVPPLERPSPVGPMAKTAGGVLLAELLLVGLVRWRRRFREADA